MFPNNKRTIRIAEGRDLLTMRSVLRELASCAGLSAIKTDRLNTAANEVARNMIDHAQGGHMVAWSVNKNGRKGVMVKCVDAGPGIPNVPLALTKGYSTKKSLGLGLPGAKLLSDYFGIESELDKGTTITLALWST